MKKTLCILTLIVLLAAGLFTLTGCGNDKESGGSKKSNNTVDISYVNGKGTFTISVPKKEDGTAKYEFTTTKPTGANSGTFYLETDNAVFSFSTSGLVYNTSTKFKEINGEQKATFDGYLDWMSDSRSGIKLSGMEQFDLNGRKALRYYNRTGGSGDYVYLGYFYMIAVDDVYPGSHANMTVRYKGTETLKESKEFDDETLSIIKSLKISLNK